MNKKIISFFLIMLAVIIAIIVARDMISDNPGRSSGNPYKLDVDTFYKVDPALIRYKEFRQLRLDMENPSGICLKDGKILLAGDRKILAISPEGKLITSFDLPGQPTAICLAEGMKLAIAYRDHFGIYQEDGTELILSHIHSDASVFTAIAVRNEKVFIADAGNRRVLIYDTEGNFKKEIRGETGDGTSHGFIIPSASFHLDFDPQGRLWVTNPGIHTLQQYDEQGNLKKSWSNSSIEIDGFNGCCNPAKFTFLPDGRFITSEKHLLRVKIYSSEGEFESVVAAPDKFIVDGQAPDIVVDAEENIIALDRDKKMIRFFKPL